mgnify:CR=1 FL=1
MKIEPYLCFSGRCEEAMDFYKEQLGAEVAFMMRFHEAPEDAQCKDVPEDKIMHATVNIGHNTIMMSDGDCSGSPVFNGISLSIALTDIVEAETIFKKLAEGGSIEMPFAQTFWSPGFGMVKDRFGVSWMVNVFE